MKYEEPIERLQQLLLFLPKSKPVGTQTELAAIRCPFCGDSAHENSAHFYIGVKQVNNKSIVVYDCKLCSSNGIMTTDLLHRLGIHELEIDEYIKSTYSKDRIKTFSEKDDTSSAIHYKYLLPKSKDSNKVDYVSKRLNMDCSNEDIINKYRIVYDIQEFMNVNKINEPSISPKIIPTLSEGVAFVSADKTSASVRNFHEDEANGIGRFNIVHFYRNIKRPFFYTCPSAVDILTPRPHIAVSEGCFNIINVQHYFYGNDNPNVILAASASKKGFYRTINALIGMTGFVSGNLDIYVDYDKTFSKEFFENSLKEFQDTFVIKLFYTEENDHDFGQPPINGTNYDFKVIRI